ncbi:hypothetical protein [Rhizobium sp. Root1220]|uniref:tetratricopeptide repeat protein n=1 Tax=Rhizobium sp. Root1220 TaxID=1736432 RepID=UPI0006F84523|nr:hypothetical protein [Rhizobium sp. Root1220]KQV78111.1 hypothetical protein ASC90_27175 [Rhizobium sp. Root1220]
MSAAGRNIAGDESRQAIDAIRGYTYQIYASALAWLQIADNELLHLEVAEDFAVSSETELTATQSKATTKNITVRDKGVLAAIDSYFFLRSANPDKSLTIRFLTTSGIGMERNAEDRINGAAALLYWRQASALAEIAPIRKLLDRLPLNPATQAAMASLSDQDYRESFLKRVIWDTEGLQLEPLLDRLRDRLLQMGTERSISSSVMMKCLGPIIARVLEACMQPTNRTLSKADLISLISEHTSISVPVDQYLQQQQLLLRLIEAQGLGADAVIRPPSLADIFKPVSHRATIPTIAPRTALRQAIQNRLVNNRSAWLFSGAGFGKTTLARLVASDVGGTWKALNVRGLAPRELSDLLYSAAQALEGVQFTGILLDDFEHFEDAKVKDAFTAFLGSIEKSSGLLVVTAYSKPSEASLAALEVASTSTLVIPELNENDIQGVISDLGGTPDIWSRYVFYASGSGHPQLVQALGRNLAARQWPFDELRNLNALLGGNSELAKVRDEARKRLVGSLSSDQLDLLARITLIPGKFDRETVLAIAEGDPPIPNAGHAFDALVGPWINEPYDGVYQTSPLVSDLATKTVSETRRLSWQRLIANKMTSGRSLDAGKMNAAFMMALASDEKSVLMRISIATIQLDNEELAKLGVAFFAIQTMRADRPLYQADPYLNVVIRLAQFLLVANEPDSDEVRTREIWDALHRELKLVEGHDGAEVLELMVLSKSVTAMVGRWGPFELISYLYRMYEIARTTEHDELRSAYNVRHDDQQTSSFGIMFLMHAQAFQKISDTLEAFTAIDRCVQSFRQELFAALALREMDSEMYFNGPWLKDHSADTMDAAIHAPMYLQMANLARGWGLEDLAVTATKYQAVILDEYGNSSDKAMQALDQAQKWAGPDNWVLVRAQAKIEFRATNYPEALTLFKRLAAMQDREISFIEKAFAFREAGITAANAGDWKLAEEFFRTARAAAKSSDLRSMDVMATGLLGDIGVARWHFGDRKGFTDAFDDGLSEVARFEVDESLNARHCHALYRHALLWAQDQLTGNVTLGNGEKPAILPGAISNPEPSPSLTDNKIAALGIARYMLASIELQCGLPARVRSGLIQKMAGKRLSVGEAWFDNHALEYYQRIGDAAGVAATSFNIVQMAVINRMSQSVDSKPDLENPREYITRDLTTDEQKSAVSLFQMLVLGSAILGLVEGRQPFVAELFLLVRQTHIDTIEPAFALSQGQTQTQSRSFELMLSGLLAEASELVEPARLQPIRLLHLHLLILQAPPATVPTSIRPKLPAWMREQWLDVVSNQGFLLTMPGQLARKLHALVDDQTAPMSSAARLIQLVIDHVPDPIPAEFRAMLTNVIASQT